MLWSVLTFACLAQAYGLAEEALVGVQQELETRLQPPQDLQDTLYKAKDGLPVPPDPVKSALDAFAKQALGNIGGRVSSTHFDRAQQARTVAVWQATCFKGNFLSAQRDLNGMLECC